MFTCDMRITARAVSSRCPTNITPDTVRLQARAGKGQGYRISEHFDFETLRSAFTAKMNFAYASRAGGGASRSRRRSNFKVKLLYCPEHRMRPAI
jgi:hypothetical protein